MKDQLAAASDEQAFQMLRKEHDALVTEAITRDHAGEVIKSTGDGLLAILFKPSVAVERAIEIQERLHSHPYIRVRIGMDMGEVSLESDALNMRDAFGRHVDWAARAWDWPMRGISASPSRSTPTHSAGSERVSSPGRTTAPTG